MIEVEELKATNPNDPRIAELTNDAKNWQAGGLLLDSVVGILSGPNTNGAIGTIANAGKPWIAAEIGDYFKQDENKDKTAAHIMAHTILGGAIAAATGNDALSGALAAGGAEALAPAVSSFLYGNKKPEELTADEKQTISSIISLGGAGVGALVGGSGSDAVNGGQLAGNAVENNYLTSKRLKDVASCLNGKSCSTVAQKKAAVESAEKLSKVLDKELKNVCKANPSSDACRTAVNTAIQYIAIQDAWSIMSNDVNRSSTENFDYLYNTLGKEYFRTYFNTIDNRADFFAASDMYEKNLGLGAKWFGGANTVSRAPITGLGADGHASSYTFAVGALLAPVYSWRSEAGDTLMNSGFENFKNLFNKESNDPVKWDINQLQTEQKSLQPIHEKYLNDRDAFKASSRAVTDTTWKHGIEGGINIIDYKSRVQYGCKLLGYTEKQGCKP